MDNQFEQPRILNKEVGLRLLGKHLYELNNKIIQIIPKNRNLHYLIHTEKGDKYYYVFKQAPFYSGDNAYSKFKGYWESINLESLDYCISQDIDFIIIGYPSGKLYCLNPLEWKEIAVENNSIREIKEGRMIMDYGKLTLKDEIVVSVPLYSLRRFN